MSLVNNLNSTERDINLSKVSEIIKKEKNHAKSVKKENYYDDVMNENKLDKNEDWKDEKDEEDARIAGVRDRKNVGSCRVFWCL